jgi:hypothetical protein
LDPSHDALRGKMESLNMNVLPALHVGSAAYCVISDRL